MMSFNFGPISLTLIALVPPMALLGAFIVSNRFSSIGPQGQEKRTKIVDLSHKSITSDKPTEALISAREEIDLMLSSYNKLTELDSRLSALLSKFETEMEQSFEFRQECRTNLLEIRNKISFIKNDVSDQEQLIRRIEKNSKETQETLSIFFRLSGTTIKYGSQESYAARFYHDFSAVPAHRTIYGSHFGAGDLPDMPRTIGIYDRPVSPRTKSGSTGALAGFALTYSGPDYYSVLFEKEKDT